MDFFNIGLKIYTIVSLISTSIITGSNVDCNGKAFHCVNSTHFKICVDLGGGVSTTVDEFLIPCPPNTVCKEYNLFECEYEPTTTLLPVTIQSEVTNEQFQSSANSVWEQLDVTTLFPTKQQQGIELSEKYYNKVNPTSANFTASFSTDAVKNHVTSNNTNNLLRSNNSDVNKTLDISQSFDKEVTFSTTESEISVTPTSPYSIDTLVTDISSNDNTAILKLFPTIQDKSTIDSLKSESLEPSYQNSLDLVATLKVTKRTNKVSTVSDLLFSDMVTLLPSNFSDPFLQENTLRTSTINHLIKSDNVGQEHNQDMLIRYNRTELNNSNNNVQDHNINSSMYSTNSSSDVNTLNSTTNIFTNEIFTGEYKKSNVNSAITSETSRPHSLEETTASTEIVLVTTNEMISPISSNTTDAIENFLNVGLNITTNVEKLGVTDSYIKTSTSFIPEITAVKTNEKSSQINNSGLNNDVPSVALTNPILEENNTPLQDTPSTSKVKTSKIADVNEILTLKNLFEVKFPTQLDGINISQYLTTAEPYLAYERSDIPSSSSTKSGISEPINHSRVLSLKEEPELKHKYQFDNVNTKENVSTHTDGSNDTHAILISLDKLESIKNTKKDLNPSSVTAFTMSLFDTATTKSATYDKIIVGNYSSTSVNTVLATVDMSNETQTIAVNFYSKLMPKRKLKEYPTTTTSLPLNTSTYTTVTTESSTSDKIESKDFGPTGVNMFPVYKKDGELTEIQAGVTDLEQIVLIKNPKNVSDLNSSLLLNTTVSPNYNTVLNVMANDSSTIVATLTTTDTVNNITAGKSNGVTTLKPISDLISKNKTWHKPVMVILATDDNNNATTTEMGNNYMKRYNEVTSLKSTSDLNPTTPKIQPTVSEELTTTNTFNYVHKENIFGNTSAILTDPQSFNEPTISLSSPNDYTLKTKDFDTIDAVGLMSLSDSIVSDLERNITPIITKPTILIHRNSGALDQVNHIDNTTKLVIKSLYEENQAVSTNASTLMNKISDVYETRTESVTALFESAKSMIVTKNTFAVVNVLSEYRAESDNNKSIAKMSNLESAITINPITYFNSNIRSNKYVISTETTLTRQSSDSVKKEINKKELNYKITTNNVQTVDTNVTGNPNSTNPTTENILTPKLVSTNNFSQPVDLNIGITDKNNNSFRDIKVKPNQITNNLVERSLIFDVININNTDFNLTDKNVIAPISNNSKSIKHLLSSFTNPPLSDIYNIGHNSFSENIILTNRTDKKKMSNSETNNKDSSQTNQNKLATALGISNIEHDHNGTEYFQMNPFKKNTTRAKEVNETILKKISYNFSEPTSIDRNNISHDFIIVNKSQATSADKNTAPKDFYNTKSKSITNNQRVNKVDLNRTELEDYSQKIPKSDSEVKSFNLIKTENCTNDLNATSASSITPSNLLGHMPSQTNTIKNKTHEVMPATALEFSRLMPSKFDKSWPLNILNTGTRSIVSNITKLEVINAQDLITVSEHTKRSNGTEKKEPQNSHGYSGSPLPIDNGVTKNIKNNTQKLLTAPTTNINYSNSKYKNVRTSQDFNCTKHGKYSDTNDCNKFYICIGRVKPVIGVCPTDTVFSEILKQCTKNITHCIRNNQFKCTAAGRFINILRNNIYFICAKKDAGFIRFTLKCQEGYYLDKNNIKCTPKLINISISDDNVSKNTKELSADKYKEMEGVSVNSENYFECKKEGKFKDPQDCRKYYVCKKGRQSIFRRKIIKCESDEVFHRKKKKCVDEESYECDK